MLLYYSEWAMTTKFNRLQLKPVKQGKQVGCWIMLVKSLPIANDLATLPCKCIIADPVLILNIQLTLGVGWFDLVKNWRVTLCQIISHSKVQGGRFRRT